MNIIDTKKFWDKRASSYQNAWERVDAIGIAAKTRLENIFVRHSVFKPGATVLDIAAGKGTLLPFINHYIGDEGKIIELDISPVMLGFAKGVAINLGIADKVTFLEADALQPPVEKERIDIVAVFNAFPHFDQDQEKALIAWADTLKYGGSLVILHSKSRAALNEMHRRHTDHNALPEPDELLNMLKAAHLTLSEYVDTDDYYLVKAKKI